MALTWSRNIEWDVDDWRDKAACRDTDPDLFFPIGSTGPAIEQIESAKTVCTECGAQSSCSGVRTGHQPGVGHLGRHLRGGAPQASQGRGWRSTAEPPDRPNLTRPAGRRPSRGPSYDRSQRFSSPSARWATGMTTSTIAPLSLRMDIVPPS